MQRNDRNILAFAAHNAAPGTFVLATSRLSISEREITLDGRPIAPLGGFFGTDPFPMLTTFTAWIRSGRLRWVEAGRPRRPGSSPLSRRTNFRRPDRLCSRCGTRLQWPARDRDLEPGRLIHRFQSRWQTGPRRLVSHRGRAPRRHCRCTHCGTTVSGSVSTIPQPGPFRSRARSQSRNGQPVLFRSRRFLMPAWE